MVLRTYTLRTRKKELRQIYELRLSLLYKHLVIIIHYTIVMVLNTILKKPQP